MDITRLKDDVSELLEEQVETLALSAEEGIMAGYSISYESPALTVAIPGGWRIVILNTINPGEQLEIVAHELGHLLLKAEGLYDVKLTEDWSEKYLTSQINSVIAHHFLIERLLSEYAIPSTYHLELQKNILTTGEELIKDAGDEPLILHGIGLRLLDLIINTDGEEDRIRELLTCSEQIVKAFELGEELLVYPIHQLPAEDQYRRIKDFFQRLGYKNLPIRLSGR